MVATTDLALAAGGLYVANQTGIISLPNAGGDGGGGSGGDGGLGFNPEITIPSPVNPGGGVDENLAGIIGNLQGQVSDLEGQLANATQTVTDTADSGTQIIEIIRDAGGGRNGGNDGGSNGGSDTPSFFEATFNREAPNPAGYVHDQSDETEAMFRGIGEGMGEAGRAVYDTVVADGPSDTVGGFIYNGIGQTTGPLWESVTNPENRGGSDGGNADTSRPSTGSFLGAPVREGSLVDHAQSFTDRFTGNEGTRESGTSRDSSIDLTDGGSGSTTRDRGATGSSNETRETPDDSERDNRRRPARGGFVV